jgi:hypothetical protein
MKRNGHEFEISSSTLSNEMKLFLSSPHGQEKNDCSLQLYEIIGQCLVLVSVRLVLELFVTFALRMDQNETHHIFVQLGFSSNGCLFVTFWRTVFQQSSGQASERAVPWQMLKLFKGVTVKKSSSILMYWNEGKVFYTENTSID